MKKIVLTVTIGFTDKISDDYEIQEVASNIARAIKNEADFGEIGIAPSESEAITTDVEVSSDILNVRAKEIIYSPSAK